MICPMCGMLIVSHLISPDRALDARVLEVLRGLDDREKLRQLVPLPSLPRVAVQRHLLLGIRQTRDTSEKGACGGEHREGRSKVKGRPQTSTYDIMGPFSFPCDDSPIDRIQGLLIRREVGCFLSEQCNPIAQETTVPRLFDSAWGLHRATSHRGPSTARLAQRPLDRSLLSPREISPSRTSPQQCRSTRGCDLSPVSHI